MARHFVIIGHRGAGSGRSENTVTGCLAGEIAGADQLEVDVQLRAGQLVLAHGSRQPSHNLLADVLAATQLPFVLHLKRRWWNPWHDRAALEMIAALPNQRRLTISSFWPGTLRHAKRRYPQLTTAFITWWPGYDLLLSRQLGAAEYHAWSRLITPAAVSRARRRRVRLIAFQSRPGVERRLFDLGAAGVITDQIALWRRARKAHVA